MLGRGRPRLLVLASMAVSLVTLREVWRGAGTLRRKLAWSGIVLGSQPGGSIAYWVARRVRPGLVPGPGGGAGPGGGSGAAPPEALG